MMCKKNSGEYPRCWWTRVYRPALKVPEVEAARIVGNLLSGTVLTTVLLFYEVRLIFSIAICDKL